MSGNEDLSSWRGRGKIWDDLDEFLPEPQLPPFVHSAYAKCRLIPHSLLAAFPSPDLTISAFVKFKVPRLAAVDHARNTPHFSLLPPSVGVDDLQHLPKLEGPSSELVVQLDRKARQMWLDGYESIEWERQRWPLWLLAYWSLVREVRQDLWGWREGITWTKDSLSSNRDTSVSFTDLRNTANRALSLLGKASWTGILAGFGTRTTNISHLATFLSSRWLSEIHETIQLKLIQHKLDNKSTTLATAVIEGTEVSGCIVRAYKTRTTVEYSSVAPSSSLFPAKRVGLRLEEGEITELGCVVFVRENHWISAVVDFPNKQISFGDPLGLSIPTHIVDAFLWWTCQHSTSTPFSISTLLCTQQPDNFSCGLLAPNSLAHHFINAKLFPPRLLAFCRMESLIEIFEHHIDSLPTDPKSISRDPYTGRFLGADVPVESPLLPSTELSPQAAADSKTSTPPVSPPRDRVEQSEQSSPPNPISFFEPPSSPHPYHSIGPTSSDPNLAPHHPLPSTSPISVVPARDLDPSATKSVSRRRRRPSPASAQSTPPPQCHTASVANTSTSAADKARTPGVSVAWTVATHLTKKPSKVKPVLNMKTAKQTTLQLVKMSPEEKSRIQKEQEERYQLVKVARAVAEKAREERELEERRANDRERQAKSRAGKKARKEAEAAIASTAAIEAATVKLLTQASSSTSTDAVKAIANANAKMSHRKLNAKQEKQQALLDKKNPNRRKNMSYQTPHTWIYVENAVSRVGWDHVAIAKYLKTHDPCKVFTRLKSSLVETWINPVTKNEWTELVQTRISKMGQVGTPGRSKILSKFPTLLEGIKSHLMGLRTSGMPISAPMVRAIVLGHINQYQPDLLETFKVGETWLRDFLTKEFGWTWRKGTRANRKRPEDGDEQCLRSLFRLAYVVQDKEITEPDMIINYDHAGVSLVPMSDMTWETRGAKQVDLQTKGDKRQMTIVVGSTPGGTVLPYQSIWGGSTAGSLPAKDAHRRDEADALGIKFVHGDKRHWASLDTSKEYIEDIFRTHIDSVIKAKNLPKDAWSILQIDCWPTHTASGPNSFLAWMKKNHPRVVVLFVPPGCTGDFQPADVGLQRWNKHLLRQAATDFFVVYTSHQLAQGTPPESILLPTDIKTLRDASIAWQVDALLGLRSRPDLVRDAWRRCEAKGFNLSWECITSARTRVALLKYIAANPDFAQELGATVVPSAAAIEEYEVTDTEMFEDDPTHTEDVALDVQRVFEGVVEGDAVQDSDDFGLPLSASELRSWATGTGTEVAEAELDRMDVDGDSASCSGDDGSGVESEDEWETTSQGDKPDDIGCTQDTNTPNLNMQTLVNHLPRLPSMTPKPNGRQDRIPSPDSSAMPTTIAGTATPTPPPAPTPRTHLESASTRLPPLPAGAPSAPTGAGLGIPISITRLGDIHPLALNPVVRKKKGKKKDVNPSTKKTKKKKTKRAHDDALDSEDEEDEEVAAPSPPKKRKLMPRPKARKAPAIKPDDTPSPIVSDEDMGGAAEEDAGEVLPALRSTRGRQVKPKIHWEGK